MKISGSMEHTKEKKRVDSVLLSLFICSNVLMQHCPRPLAPASAELYFKLTWNKSNDPKGPENIKSLPWWCTGRHFTAATRHDTSCSEDKKSSEWRSSWSKEHTKETNIADSVLLSLFMCSSVMVQHCLRPLAPDSAELCFQTSFPKVAKWINK